MKMKKVIKGLALVAAFIGAAVKMVEMVDTAYKNGYEEGLLEGDDKVYTELNEIAAEVHERFNRGDAENESTEPV